MVGMIVGIGALAATFAIGLSGSGAVFATMANWAANLVVAVSYLSIISWTGRTGAFLL